MRLTGPKYRRGFSLIELGVATAIYSLGLGSLSLMMMLAVRGTTEASFDTTASIQAVSLAELILMNRGAASHYLTTGDTEPAACDPGIFCSAEEMAAWQMYVWRERLAGELPSGQGLVCRDSTPDDGDATDAACDGGGGSVVKIFWSVPTDAEARVGDSGRQVLRLPWP